MRKKSLTTEQRNPASAKLDQMSALEIVSTMNREDARVPRAIRSVLPRIAEAVDLIAERLANGGRLFYVGTGTSGRIGALDASECPPTFGTSPHMVQFLIAGGEAALVHATEASEDSAELGRKNMASRRPTAKDVIVGIAASGSTPYTIAALELARKKGAATVAISCNRNSEISNHADVAIEVEVGPEVLTGSSRLKAGTAQKLICNMLSTGAMARMGYVYSNLMVNLHLINRKLVDRGVRILQDVTGAERELAEATLEKAGMRLPVAIVMLNANTNRAEATRRLRKTKGSVRLAIENS